MTQHRSFNTELDAAFGRYAQRMATITPDGQRLSFADLHKTVRAFAAKLRQNGIGPGQVVVPFSENPTVFQALVLALLRVGATVPIVMSVDGAIRNGLKVDAAITLADRPSLLARNITFDQSWLSASGEDGIGPDGYWIGGSSGTTGVPKYYLYAASNFLDWMDIRAPHIDPFDTDVLVTLPVASGYGFWLAMQALLAGGAYLRPMASARDTLVNLRSEQPLDIIATPALLQDMLAAVADGVTMPKTLRQILLGGSTVSKNLASKVEGALGVPVLNIFGSMEAGANAHCRPSREPYAQNVIGIPFNGVEMRVEGPDGKLAPVGSEGPIAVRVDPKCRALKALTGDFPYDDQGWFRSGDLGFVDAEGRLVMTGRKSDLINSSGFKVAPSRYEDLVLGGSEATEVAAFGLPNDLGSEDVGLAMVCPGTPDMDAIRALLQSVVGPAVKFHLFQVPALPVNPTGKIDRAALRDQFSAS